MAPRLDESTHFPTREDAAWLVLGLFVFTGAAGLFGVAVLLSGDRLAGPEMLPLAILLIFSGGILELGLRRLQTNLTGKRMAAWPMGMVSLNTITKAVAPATVSAAARRIGVAGWVAASVFYLVVLADLVVLVIVTG